jgi:hypothetical protein
MFLIENAPAILCWSVSFCAISFGCLAWKSFFKD